MTESSQRFKNEINSVLAGLTHRAESIMVCKHTPKILQEVGLRDLPILFSQSHVRNCLHPKGRNPHWHGLNIDFLSNIEVYLEKPAFIIDSLSSDDSVVLALENVDDDNLPIIAAIRIDGLGQYNFQKLNSNYLTSVYGHNHLENMLLRAFSLNSVLYFNKEKTRSLGNLAELQLLRWLPQTIEPDGIIKQSENIVNNNLEKQQKDDDRNAIAAEVGEHEGKPKGLDAR